MTCNISIFDTDSPDSKNKLDFYGMISAQLTYHYIFKNLASKAEFGSTRSEKGYQLIAKQMAGRIAQNLGGNPDKAEALCMSVGAFFPRNGAAGMQFIKGYIANHNIDMDYEALAIGCVEESVGRINGFISKDFHQTVTDYFTNSNTSDLEVNIVKVCQNTISAVKRIEKHYPDIEGGNLLYSVTEDIIRNSKTSGKLTTSEKLVELMKSVPDDDPLSIPEEESKMMSESLDQYIDSFGYKGIFRYITSDGK